MATKKKRRSSAKKACACPKGFGLSTTDPLTGKRYKRQRCTKIVTRGRKASVKTKAPKCLSMKGSCPTGYTLGAFNPRTGRRFKSATCVRNAAAGSKGSPFTVKPKRAGGRKR